MLVVRAAFRHRRLVPVGLATARYPRKVDGRGYRKGKSVMSGSSLAPIIIPIVVVPVLAFWLIMVAYADRHPAWRGSGQASARQAAGQRSGEEARVPAPAPRPLRPAAADAARPARSGQGHRHAA